MSSGYSIAQTACVAVSERVRRHTEHPTRRAGQRGRTRRSRSRPSCLDLGQRGCCVDRECPPGLSRHRWQDDCGEPAGNRYPADLVSDCQSPTLHCPEQQAACRVQTPARTGTTSAVASHPVSSNPRCSESTLNTSQSASAVAAAGVSDELMVTDTASARDDAVVVAVRCARGSRSPVISSPSAPTHSTCG
ncbi:MAG: hypothetical protein J07HX5_01199 [halophilic archaeon J07HX5]|nr:MAG: hypothetical protein J07HX5_01199 [halophilic archaeon J07HX5]